MTFGGRLRDWSESPELVCGFSTLILANSHFFALAA